ncbi:uncharacterized protein LOC126654619 isoform X2 [Mercurialis annua]|uniref:uncharacterized protein LOC126654619 isoform X2 n=1 Tax=Mercurialis annua TaxID=3986 RepID=UPI002160B271|nr:uncharacterized protein LOC126654619 isoform X2 [Mercurialis annua]
MCRHLFFAKLCCLITNKLPVHTELEVVNLSKEKEKDLLIALSQIYRDIQKLECGGGLDLHHEDDHNCLIKVLADLIILLTVENRYVQHLVGNILVVISEFVSASGSEWDSFVKSLFICLKLVICNMLSHSLELATCGDGVLKCDPSSFVVLKSRLVNADGSTAAAIIRVLRNILKNLKQEDDDELHGVYLGSVSSFLSNMSSYIRGESQAGQISGTKESDSRNVHYMDALLERNICDEQKKILFLGTFIQFLCSLVEQSFEVEAEIGLQDHYPILCLITSFVPKFLSWQGNCDCSSVSLYFRHKLLMLMVRLSNQTCIGYFTLTLWLQLLHDNFGLLLWKCTVKLEFAQDESLEGSPFLSSLSDGEISRINSNHLQRWAVLLFLRCCFGLISSTRDSSKQCTCGTLNYCLCYSVSDSDCCGRKKGFLELYNWLQEHLEIDMSVGRELYIEKCINFTSSFLQLFMHEDDVLFKVLLQLRSIHSCVEQWSNGEKYSLGDIEEDILSHISHIINPVNLFHLFLAELHYDHQVILDYLISKDTGTDCAEYLLRCLRTVCNSWHLFTTFSMQKKIVKYSSCKKRKTCLDISSLQVEASSVHALYSSSTIAEQGKKDVEYIEKQYKTRKKLFKEAKGCLLSLKDSVQNLQQKNLFPYNPEVLLRRDVKNPRHELIALSTC